MSSSTESDEASDFNGNVVVCRDRLPTAKNTFFPNSGFFRNNGRQASLPSPEKVRQKARELGSRSVRRKPHCVPFISQGLFVKYGRRVTIAQGIVLWLIRSYLGARVPVPEIYGWCRDDDEAFIYIEYIKGPTLEDVMSDLSQKDLLDVASQLRAIVLAFRSLRQAPNDRFLGDICGQKLPDIIFNDCSRPAGPFSSVTQFNDYFMFLTWMDPEPPPKVCNHYMRPGIPDNEPVYFTHADLNPANIILSKSSQVPTIISIVDFEQSGWYPAYWEGCKCRWNAGHDSDWSRLLVDVFAPHGEYLPIFSWMSSAGHAC